MCFAREGLADASPVDEELLLQTSPSLCPVVHGRVERDLEDLVLGLQALLQFLSGRAVDGRRRLVRGVARLVNPAAS